MKTRNRRPIAFVLAVMLIFTSIFSGNNFAYASERAVRGERKRLGEDKAPVITVAKWSGTEKVPEEDGMRAYADKEVPNDFSNREAYITFTDEKGKNQNITFSPSKDTYALGTKGKAKYGSYYELVLSTKKIGNIELSYNMRGSNSSAKEFKVLYSTDGVNFTQVDEKLNIIPDDSNAGHNFKNRLPEGANNQEKLYIRVQVASNEAVKHNVKGIGGGNNYFRSILVTGNPLESDEIVSYVRVASGAGIVKRNDKISLVTATSGAAIYYNYNGQGEQLYDDDEKITLSELPATITTYATKEGKENSFVSTYEFRQEQVAAVQATPNGGARVKGTEVSLTTKTKEATILYSINGEEFKEYEGKLILDTLPVTIKTYAVKENYLDSPVSEVNFTERVNENYNIYFGQVHSHTNYSDGTGSCDEAFNYAKNQAEQIDFLAVTDHSNKFDNDAQASITDGTPSTEWVEGHELADKYTDDTFVGIYGYEMTWSNGLGHINTFKTDGFQSRNQGDFKDKGTALQNYYERLKTVPDSFSQFNHPGPAFGDFTDFDYYDPEIDKLITLIEVGNGEGAIGEGGYFPSYEYYTRALDKGWHVAPTNNQDNHKGKWGNANTARTVVLADSLTRENVYEALNNLRTYATEDNDLQIQYKLNGEDMGTILNSKPNEVNIKVNVKDPTDTINKVEVIVNGGLSIAEKKIAGKEGEVEFNLPPDYSYYYIRVTEEDKDIAVTSPVWISEVEEAGISNVFTLEKLPIKGKALDITTELYNDEESPLELDSLEFCVKDEQTGEDTIIHTADLAKQNLTSIESGTKQTYTFSYLHNKAGDLKLDIILKGKLNGTSKVYRGVLHIKYDDPNMVKKVIVDGSHYNEYVAGYNSNQIGNFAEVAMEHHAQVEVVKEKITDEVLKNCDLLVISAPSTKSGKNKENEYKVAHFEDEFIKAVKNYVERGGQVIITATSDNQDTEECQVSTELNRLLKAIGATTRVNSDQAVDDKNKKKDQKRTDLKLTDYAKNSVFMKDIGEKQKFNVHNGCTLLINEEAEDSGKVTALVKGFKETYSEDTKKYDSNYKEIEPGSATFLAHETVGKSNIFISGSFFISDYEVQIHLENSYIIPASNKNVIENILINTEKAVNVTNISEVRRANKGDVFTIEGTVTAGTVSGNAFFDTIYVQDETGGINIFPINEGEIKVGQKVRVTGSLDDYLGDIELRVIEAKVIDTKVNPIEPVKVSTKDAMNYKKVGGHLVCVTGKVTDVIKKEGIIETIKIKDKSGVEARVFVDGYIGYSNENGEKLENIAVKGKTIHAIGLVSFDPDGVRIRVRDRSEIVLEDSNDSNKVNNESHDSTEAGENPSNNVEEKKENNSTTIKDELTGSVLVIETKKDEQGTIVGYDATIDTKCSKKVIDKSKATLEVVLSDKILKEIEKKNQDKPVAITLNIAKDDIMEQIKREDVESVIVAVKLPDIVKNASNVTLEEIKLEQDVLKMVKQGKKDITYRIANEKGITDYAWNFKGADLKTATNMKSINIVANFIPTNLNEIKLERRVDLSTGKGKKGVVVDFAEKGQLPTKATFKVKMREQDGFVKNQKVYVYSVGRNRLETIPTTNRTVDKNGYVSFEMKRGAKYVILSEKANHEIVSTLVERTKVKVAKTLQKGSTTRIKVTVPFDAKGIEKVMYQSKKKGIVTISKTGRILAKKEGTTVIKTTVIINNEKRIYETKITVK